MRIIGVDLHALQQSIAMLDTETGELVETTLYDEGEKVREFSSALPRPVLVGIEAMGSMAWFLKLMEELKKIECRVGQKTIRLPGTGETTSIRKLNKTGGYGRSPPDGQLAV